MGLRWEAIQDIATCHTDHTQRQDRERGGREGRGGGREREERREVGREGEKGGIRREANEKEQMLTKKGRESEDKRAGEKIALSILCDLLVSQ